MHRFTLHRTICTTLLGATYECSFNAPAYLLPTATHQRASLVLKCSSLTTHKRLLEAQENDSTAFDDPLHERDVVARLIASGGHAHVLQYYNHFLTTDETTGDKCVCLLMEHCGGGDLFTHLQASTTSSGLSVRESVSLMRQVVRGVLFLQSRLSLAHRDLSLENVFLRDGVCKLADFGLAAPLNQRAYGRVGKRPYMAPEVVPARADGYDPAAADVWSLGVVLFILLTGSPLVDAASREDPRFLALMHRGVGAILLSWGFEVSNNVVELMVTMPQKDPTHRPPIGRIRETLDVLVAAADDQAA